MDGTKGDVGDCEVSDIQQESPCHVPDAAELPAVFPVGDQLDHGSVSTEPESDLFPAGQEERDHRSGYNPDPLAELPGSYHLMFDDQEVIDDRFLRRQAGLHVHNPLLHAGQSLALVLELLQNLPVGVSLGLQAFFQSRQ